MTGVFRYVNPATIYWGPRSLERLSDERQRLDIQRPFCVTTRSVAGMAAVMARLSKALCCELAGAVSLIGQHAPEHDVEVAVEAAKVAGADGVVSIGGGSPIDAAKIVALELGNRPHVAIPTTLSAAELAP